MKTKLIILGFRGVGKTLYEMKFKDGSNIYKITDSHEQLSNLIDEYDIILTSINDAIIEQLEENPVLRDISVVVYPDKSLFREYINRGWDNYDKQLFGICVDYIENCILKLENIKSYKITKEKVFLSNIMDELQSNSKKNNIKTLNKYDTSHLTPYDKVLVRMDNYDIWTCTYFSYFNNDKYNCMGVNYFQCLPYRDGTKQLLGTNDTPTEFYNIY